MVGSFRAAASTAHVLRQEPMMIALGRSGGAEAGLESPADRDYVEETSRIPEGELSQFVDMVPSHLWQLSAEGDPVFFNKHRVDFLGLRVKDMESPGMTPLTAMIEALVHPGDALAFEETLRRCLGTGEPFAMRYRARRNDGVYRWMSSRAEAMRDDAGRIIRWCGADHDIDDEVHAKALLQQGKEQLEQMVDAVPVRIWSVAPAGGPVYFNKRYQDHLRSVLASLEPVDELNLDTLLRVLVHPDDAPEVRRTLLQCFESGSACLIRFRWREQDGAYRWAECRVEPRRNQDGVIVQWYGVSLDIDEEVCAQAALRARERELSALFDVVPAFIVRLAPNGEPTLFNKRTKDLLGMEVEDLDKAGMSRLAVAMGAAIHPEDMERMRGLLEHSLATGEPYSIKYRHRLTDSVFRWMHGRAEPLRDGDGKIVHWYTATIDIDDEVRAQEALREREQELSHLVDMVPSYLWRLTPEGEPNFYNRRLSEFLGPDTANANKPGMSRLSAMIEAAIHADDAARFAEALKLSLATGTHFSMRYRMRRADGVYRWVEGRAEAMQGKDGCIVQWYGFAHDIDDQLRAEDVLRQSEQRLQQLIDAVPINIWSFTAAGKLSYVSKRYMNYLNIPDASFDDFAKVVRELVHSEDVSETHRIAAHGFQTGTAFVSRYRRRERDGSYRWCEARAEPLRDQNGAVLHWYAVSIDIDDEKRAQDALQRAFDKLAVATQAASLAELSASIAHEVNQPLAAIIARSQACQRWLSVEPPNIERAKVTAEGIVRDANSAADVVSRIRALFKQAPHRRSLEDVNHLIREVCRLMADAIAGKDARLETNLAPNLPSIALDRVQVQQVLVNLIRNGIEAMDGLTDRARVLQIQSCVDGPDAIRVEVRDTGIGIGDTAYVFDPFFTTKPQGMGMGLAICRSILESHGGKLWAANNPTCGALVAFTLPLEPEDAAPEGHSSPPRAQ